MAGSLISMLIVAAVVSLPASARAGVVSDMLASLLGTRVVAETGEHTQAKNVQTMALIKAAHNLDPNPSRGGGDTTIIDDAALASEEGPSGTMADISDAEEQSHQISVYVVRPGDTLSGIAELFNVSINTIMWTNDISRGDVLQKGEKLTILPITGVRHTVEEGETLKSIAEEYNGNLEEIENYNGIAADESLAVGSEVIIPDGEVSAPAAPSTSSTQRAAAPSSSSPAASGPTYAGYYMRPVSGGVRTQGIHGYNGIDIAADAGTSIMAAAGGEVIISRVGGWNGGYGNYVVINHDNGTQTLYAHNSQNIVSVGQRVVQGQVIGYIGSTGRSTGSHLHFEIRGAHNPF